MTPSTHCISAIAMSLSSILVSVQVCSATSISLQYDPNGNLINGDGFFREYNGLNQLMRVRNGSSNASQLLVSFSYDPLQERVAVKTEYNHDGSVKETTYYFGEDFIRVVNASGTFDSEYVFLGSQQVAQINPDESIVYVHANHIGSTTAITTQNGAVLENTSYSPHGDIITGGQTTRYDYTAQENDEAIHDYDYHARRYKPEWGIFTQPDNAIRTYVPQSLNRYAYVVNNPIKYVDAKGHDYMLLLDPTSAGGFGHAAGIVYNEQIAVFYSFEGQIPDGESKDILTGTIDIGSGVNYEGKSFEDVSKRGYLDRYSQRRAVHTDKEKDDAMIAKMRELRGNGKYNVLFDNCIVRQQQIMDAGGIPHSHSSLPTLAFGRTSVLLTLREFDDYLDNFKQAMWDAFVDAGWHSESETDDSTA